MKNIILAILIGLMPISATFAQHKLTEGPLTIVIESIRPIGDQWLVSGKFMVNREVRFTGIKVDAVTDDGDNHGSSDFWWGGKSTYLSSYDMTLAPEIPYAFDITIASKNKPVKSLTALSFTINNWTDGTKIKIMFKNVPIPFNPNPNQPANSIEISKDIFLKWNKYEESANGLTIKFAIENLSSKDKDLKFPAYSHDVKVIDNEGNVNAGELSFKNEVIFSPGVPIAGSIKVANKLKAADVIMVQFSTAYFKYSFKSPAFPGK